MGIRIITYNFPIYAIYQLNEHTIARKPDPPKVPSHRVLALFIKHGSKGEPSCPAFCGGTTGNHAKVAEHGRDIVYTWQLG
jgi:hypothetical protein